MDDLSQRLTDFIDYNAKLKGDEKGEAQLFCDRFFRAFGHDGIIEAEGSLEARIKFSSSGKTKFADCLWSPEGRAGVLIEMKKRAERNLENHFPQVRDYWVEMNPEIAIGPLAQKPRYIILCNFDRFIIYDYLTKVDDVALSELENRSSAFNFMLKEPRKPIFHNNEEDISRTTANTLGELYKYLTHTRKEKPKTAQRFILQSVLALFSEDFGLLPNDFFTEIIRDCQSGQNPYDLIGGLFRQMANPKPARGGRFQDVKYFNGGLFDTVEPLDLDEYSLKLLADAAKQNWKAVNPAIFGSLFEGTLGKEERHALGAHFTAEADILKIVNPTIVRPWRERIDKANTLTELRDIYVELGDFTVLDPACGCGNFLYIAYHILRELEQHLIRKIADNFSGKAVEAVLSGGSRITSKNFKGIDIQPIAVEVAKMTLMIAKEIAAARWNAFLDELRQNLHLDFDPGLPLDRLDECVVVGDALFDKWPVTDVVIGNPPYLDARKMAIEYGRDYVDKLREAYPDIPGRADYCVYWFRRTHDELLKGKRAGLVGTNSIRQNYSRIGGLDYIVSNGGVITDAVSSQNWVGEAAVSVSIVNWIKGTADDWPQRKIHTQLGDSHNSKWTIDEVSFIPATLSARTDVSKAVPLNENYRSKICFEGIQPGHNGFRLTERDSMTLISQNSRNAEIIYPYLNGQELLTGRYQDAPRYLIDFSTLDSFEASQYKEPFEVLTTKVRPQWEANADEEFRKTGKSSGEHQNRFRTWWQLKRRRSEMLSLLQTLGRFTVCSRVTKRPVFEFLSKDIRPDSSLSVFGFSDDYSFGVLQSELHWEWFCARCSTLTGRYRYTPNTVFNAFPWPQHPTLAQIRAISECARELRRLRRDTMAKHDWSLRELYRKMEISPENPVSKAQEKLDDAVRKAYGMSKRADNLAFLLELNQICATKEKAGEPIQGPGLPETFIDLDELYSDDCVTMRDGGPSTPA